MAKYDSPRKSLPHRHASHAQAPQYMPTVCRTALEEADWQDPSVPPAGPPSLESVARVAAELDELEVDAEVEALPVPELGVPKVSQIVARRAPGADGSELPRTQRERDPLAMLEAATIWGCPRPRR